MKLKTLTIFVLGFAAGFVANQYLTQHIETEVANRIDDQKVLQQAGYTPPFHVDSVEPTRWSE